MADEPQHEAPSGRRLAAQGNTDAKLLAPSESKDNDELPEEAVEDPEGGSAGGKAA